MSIAIFVPGGTNVFIVPLCALRYKWFHCNIVRLAEQMFLLYHCAPGGTNIFIVPLCALRNNMFSL